MNNRIDIHLMKRLLADYETLEETQPTIGNTMYINEQKRVMENRIMIAAHCDRYVNRQEWTFDKPLDPGIYAVKDYEDKSFDGVTIEIYRPNSEGLLRCKDGCSAYSYNGRQQFKKLPVTEQEIMA